MSLTKPCFVKVGGPMGGCRKLTPEEVVRILELLNSNRYPLRDRALFVLGLKTGFRISELLSIRVGDVYQGGKVQGYLEVAKRQMKGKKRSRTVKLHIDAQEALRIYLESRGSADPGTPLFLSRQGGKAISRVMAWNVLKKAYKACGLEGKLATHTMRKTFANNAHKVGGNDVFKTMKALGHASPESTVAYLEVNQDEIDDMITKS